MNDRKKKVLKRMGIVFGVLVFLALWGYFGYFAFGNNWFPGLKKDLNLIGYIAFIVLFLGPIIFTGMGGGILCSIGYGLYKLVKWIFCCKEKANPVPLPQKTKTDLPGPPKDLWDYGEGVELPEKKEEPKIINPWQNRATAGGGQ